jgi:hypothetical protein
MVASSNDTFQVRHHGGRLEVWDIKPDHAWPGHEVTIRGRGFSRNVRVWFGNTPMQVTRVERDEIRVVVPNQWGEQHIVVEDNGERAQTRERLRIGRRDRDR